jgi:membrane protein DedA with SNARE-associated domain
MNEVSQFLTSHGGSILFLAILAEQLGFPVPAAPVLVTAGALSVDGGLSPALATGITVLACLPGDLIWYYAGRRRGNRVMQFIRRIFLCNFPFGRSERLLTKYGIAAIAGAKFIPGVSFVIPALAGAFKISLGRFIWFDVLGSLFYGIFYIFLGVAFSNEISGAIASLSALGSWATALALVAVTAFAAYQYARQRKAARAQSKGGSSALMTVSEA